MKNVLAVLSLVLLGGCPYTSSTTLGEVLYCFQVDDKESYDILFKTPGTTEVPQGVITGEFKLLNGYTSFKFNNRVTIGPGAEGMGCLAPNEIEGLNKGVLLSDVDLSSMKVKLTGAQKEAYAYDLVVSRYSGEQKKEEEEKLDPAKEGYIPYKKVSLGSNKDIKEVKEIIVFRFSKKDFDGGIGMKSIMKLFEYADKNQVPNINNQDRTNPKEKLPAPLKEYKGSKAAPI